MTACPHPFAGALLLPRESSSGDYRRALPSTSVSTHPRAVGLLLGPIPTSPTPRSDESFLGPDDADADETGGSGGGTEPGTPACAATTRLATRRQPPFQRPERAMMQLPDRVRVAGEHGGGHAVVEPQPVAQHQHLALCRGQAFDLP